MWVGLGENRMSSHLETSGQFKILEEEGAEGILPLLSGTWAGARQASEESRGSSITCRLTI